MQGTVTNVTDVKPLLTVATYVDTNHATEAYQEVSGGACPLFGPAWSNAYRMRLAVLLDRKCYLGLR
jgi:DNA replicative helicase MCM subunit Mcm2 (Cdc46/Mcm family)